MVPPPSSAVGDLASPHLLELGGFSSLLPVSPEGTLVGPAGGVIANPQRPPGPRPPVAYVSKNTIWYIDGTWEDRSPARPDTLSGYPANGSIATLPPDKKSQNDVFLPDVMRLYPPEETGTGRVKYHTLPNGDRVSYCGTIRPDAEGNVAACSNKPYAHQIIGLPNSCKRRGCPECSPDWSQKAAKRVQQSINGYILATVPEGLKNELLEALGNLHGGTDGTAPDEWREMDMIQAVLDKTYRYLSRHIVISPPREVVAAIVERTERALERKGIDLENDHIRYRNEFHRIFMKKYRRKVDQIARLAGISAFVDVDHNIRLKGDPDAERADRELNKNRYRGILITSRWRHRVRFSPHSHFMAWGYLMPVEEFYEKTGGWVYKNLGAVTSVGGLTDYLLSHAPDIDGMHSYRVGGDMKNYRVAGEIKIPLFRKCLECLEEGKMARDAGMVLAKLQSVEYHRDENRQNKVISWEFKGISNKPYRTTEIIWVYERRPPDPPLKVPNPVRVVISMMYRAMLELQNPIPPWLSEEERDRRKRLFEIERKERERIAKANTWLPYAMWISLPPDEREGYKWRKYFSQETYAEATPDWLLKMFEWS